MDDLMIFDGSRISELSRFELVPENLQETDSMLLPISYNGATKAIAIGDVMKLFDKRDPNAAQDILIEQNRANIAYLFNKLDEMAEENDITLQGVIESQAVTDDLQNTNIATNTANIAKQTNINSSQQTQIDTLNTLSTSFSYSLTYIENINPWGVYNG